MQAFTFLRATDARQAIDAGARSPTAQQGASVRFVAGGTTLLATQRQSHADAESLSRPGADVALAPVGGHPLADAEQAEPGAGRPRARPAVVDDLDLGVRRCAVLRHAERDRGVTGGRVADHVGECLLGSPVERQ